MEKIKATCAEFPQGMEGDFKGQWVCFVLVYEKGVKGYKHMFVCADMEENYQKNLIVGKKEKRKYGKRGTRRILYVKAGQKECQYKQILCKYGVGEKSERF